jgi:MvaI/BcnI restriction endonuclease family
LSVDIEENILKEISNKSSCQQVVQWSLKLLHERLLTKHRETFWISASSIKSNGREFFQFERVRHTKNPSVVQFDELLGSGGITLDHLIKSLGTSGAKEKEPLFKIAKDQADLLFPAPKYYDLQERKLSNG